MRALILATLVLASAGCGGTKTPAAPELPDVIYVGKASDEALSVMWPKLGDSTSTDQLALSSPAPQAANVPLTPPPVITWSAYASLGPKTSRPAWPGFPDLGFSLVSRAWAHEPPVTGNIYMVELDGNGSTLRIFSSPDTTYTPTVDEWKQVTGGVAGTISVRIWSAYMEQNVIKEGPYVSPGPVSFQTAAAL